MTNHWQQKDDKMKDKVRLKSYQNGIKIAIDENASMDEVLREVAEKFKDSEKFFGKAKLAVTFEGRKNTTEEENAILNTIQEISSVNIVCVVSPERSEAFDRAVGSIARLMESDTAQFYRGDLTSKKILETEQNIIILGNVHSGCCVVSRKNIIVLGKLEGSAYAGVDGKSHFIAALSMAPETIRIGEHKGKYKRKSRWGRKKNSQPRIAYLKDEKIVFEDLTLTEELLQNLE